MYDVHTKYVHRVYRRKGISKESIIVFSGDRDIIFPSPAYPLTTI